MPTTPGTPGRRRREREDQYIAFNNNPKQVGTRSGVAMPNSVRRNSAGFEDGHSFFRSSPTAPDTDSRTTTYSRRTPGTGKTMRTSVAPSTAGRGSAASSRRKRMSDLGDDGPDDTFAQGSADLLVEEEYEEHDIHATPFFKSRHVPAVPLPPSSRRGARTPASGGEYADLPSPSLASPSTRKPMLAARKSKTTRLSTSISPDKRRVTATSSRLAAAVEIDEIGDTLAIDAALDPGMGEYDVEEDDHEEDGRRGSDDAGRGRDGGKNAGKGKDKGKGKGRETAVSKRADPDEEQDAEENEEEQEEEDEGDVSSHEQGRRATLKSRLSTRTDRSRLDDGGSDEDADPRRPSLAPSIRYDGDITVNAETGADETFGGDDVDPAPYGDDDASGNEDDPLGDVGQVTLDRIDPEEDQDEGDADTEERAMADEEGLGDIEEERASGEEEEEESRPSKSKSKGKGKAPSRPPPAKSAGRARGTSGERTTAPKGTPKRKRLSKFPNEIDGNGYQGDFQMRVSGRQHIKPLEFWRGEKVSYGKGQHQAVIKEVVTIPRDPVVPLSKPKGSGYRAKSRARSRSKAGSAPPLEDWDLETDQNGTVRNYVTKEEEDKRIAFPSHLLQPKLVETRDGGRFYYQKCFGDDYQASGFVEIDEGCYKPSKFSNDNSFVFYVIEGAAHVSIHRTAFVIAKGGQFLVPRGNDYKIENATPRGPLRLFFAQARKVRMSEEEEAAESLATTASQVSRVMDSQPSQTKTKTKGKGGKVNGQRWSATPVEEEEEEEEEEVPRKKVRAR